MNLREQILAVTNAYQKGTGLTTNTISKRIFNDNGRKLAGMRREEDPDDLLTGTFEHAMRVMSNTWPDSEEWPEGVRRPPPIGKST